MCDEYIKSMTSTVCVPKEPYAAPWKIECMPRRIGVSCIPAPRKLAIIHSSPGTCSAFWILYE